MRVKKEDFDPNLEKEIEVYVPNQGTYFDINVKKGIMVLFMFIIMFAFPAVLYKKYFQNLNPSSNTMTPAQELEYKAKAQVAGVSTTSETNTTTTSDESKSNNTGSYFSNNSNVQNSNSNNTSESSQTYASSQTNSYNSQINTNTQGPITPQQFQNGRVQGINTNNNNNLNLNNFNAGTIFILLGVGMISIPLVFYFFNLKTNQKQS